MPKRLSALLSLVVAACGPSIESSPDGSNADAAVDASSFADADLLPQPDALIPPAQMYVHTSDTLYIMDDESFDAILVGSFDMGEDLMTDFAVTPNGRLYGISETKLYSIDAATAAATAVADVPGVDNVGLTFLPDGTLLATDKTGGVRKVDPVTGAVTEIGAFGGGYATAGDLVAVADGTMYAISDDGPNGDEYDNNVLLTVNTETGAAAPVGQIGFGGVFGCAYANGKVYAFTRDGDVIEINRSTGAGTRRRTHSMAWWGAGVTPLVVVE